jgi:membrane-associated protease RseP (regulator of RpoE activity)
MDTSDSIFILSIIIGAWFVFYTVAKLLGFEKHGVVLSPLYALFKSTKLNDFILKLGYWKPGLWRVLGNVGVVSSVGQAGFISWILFRNLWNFLYIPEKASPVQPLIPGLTVSVPSLPWFLVAAGLVILVHELAHGVMCVIDGVPIKSSAFLLAVITFGGAVEADEEALRAASLMTKMRIYGAGSLINLLFGLSTIPIMIAFGTVMPIWMIIFLNWIYFIAVNLAMMNMLPIGPLDGGQMWREFTKAMGWGELTRNATTFGFIVLIFGNIGLSLARFGFIPI